MKMISSRQHRHDERRDKNDRGESCDPFYYLDAFGRGRIAILPRCAPGRNVPRRGWLQSAHPQT